MLDYTDWKAVERHALNPELSMDHVTQGSASKDLQHKDHFLNSLRKTGLPN